LAEKSLFFARKKQENGFLFEKESGNAFFREIWLKKVCFLREKSRNAGK
jgi:hypothetical protein